MPAVFIGHGSPMNALADNPFTQSLARFGESLTVKPTAVLCVSAHWLTRGTEVQASPKPKTIHDFGGFPEELYRVEYPAPGSPEYAAATARLLAESHETNEWGLDHGTWSVLRHVFPAADIPVFQVSIDLSRSMREHFDFARALRPLREQGVLIVGSGNIVHNLRVSIPRLFSGDAAPLDWAVEFDQWVKDRIVSGDFASLADYEQTGAAGRMSVPTADHYIPLLYTLAAADPDEPLEQLYEEVSYGGMSMRTFVVG